MTKQEVLYYAILCDDLPSVISILKDPKIELSSKKFHRTLSRACKNGYIKLIKTILLDKRVDPSYNDNYLLYIAAIHNHLKLVEILLQDKRVDPSTSKNYTIKNSIFADEKITQLLWKDKRIRKTLKNDNPELYTTLITSEVKNKISEF